MSTAAQKRSDEAATRAYKALVARHYETLCRRELDAPSLALSYVSPATWEHLAEHWKKVAERLEAPPVKEPR